MRLVIMSIPNPIRKAMKLRLAKVIVQKDYNYAYLVI
jgi:hypothetical protein